MVESTAIIRPPVMAASKDFETRSFHNFLAFSAWRPMMAFGVRSLISSRHSQRSKKHVPGLVQTSHPSGQFSHPSGAGGHFYLSRVPQAGSGRRRPLASSVDGSLATGRHLG